jgi:hypothetical protein
LLFALAYRAAPAAASAAARHAVLSSAHACLALGVSFGRRDEPALVDGGERCVLTIQWQHIAAR